VNPSAEWENALFDKLPETGRLSRLPTLNKNIERSEPVRIAFPAAAGKSDEPSG